MLDLTTEQKRKLTIWAYERLWDAVDAHTYDGDMWFTVDDAIPELSGKIDVNLWDEEREDGKFYIQATAYPIGVDDFGNIQTKCDTWEILF